MRRHTRTAATAAIALSLLLAPHSALAEDKPDKPKTTAELMAIIEADPLWGPDEEWKLLIDHTTTEAAPPVPPQLRSAEKGAPITTTLPHDPGPTTPTAERAAGLGAFAAELQDLYRP